MYRVCFACGFLLVAAAFAQSPARSAPLVAKEASGLVSPNTATADHPTPNRAGKVNDLSVVPALPQGKTTLLGGTILRVDHVRDRLTLQVFGGSPVALLFDERTRVFRDGRPGSTDDLKTGTLAYVDTMLDGTSIFARNVRLVATSPVGQGSGQIVEVDARTGELELRDKLSPEPVKMRLAQNASVFRGDQHASVGDLRAGTLVALTFTPATDGVPRVSRISILASPGAQFVFSGRIEYLNVPRGMMVVVDPRDNQSYEVNFDSSARGLTRDLREGADVTVQAAFDGSRYQAQSVTSIPSNIR